LASTVIGMLLMLTPGDTTCYLQSTYPSLCSDSIFAQGSLQALKDLYKLAIDRRVDILVEKLNNVIRSSVPGGINEAIPGIAEFETLNQSPKANFFHDANGKLHFRQYRRININAVMSSRSGLQPHTPSDFNAV
ncbi:hypothetical protein PMAYCL1PPCAC_00018, partial [Pristionchus mayeri]